MLTGMERLRKSRASYGGLLYPYPRLPILDSLIEGSAMHGSFRRCTMLLVPLFAFTGATVLGAPKDDYVAQYKGTPFHDSRYQGGPQKIPGKVLCAYYDL